LAVGAGADFAAGPALEFCFAGPLGGPVGAAAAWMVTVWSSQGEVMVPSIGVSENTLPVVPPDDCVPVPPPLEPDG